MSVLLVVGKSKPVLGKIILQKRKMDHSISITFLVAYCYILKDDFCILPNGLNVICSKLSEYLITIFFQENEALLTL